MGTIIVSVFLAALLIIYILLVTALLIGLSPLWGIPLLFAFLAKNRRMKRRIENTLRLSAMPIEFLLAAVTFPISD